MLQGLGSEFLLHFKAGEDRGSVWAVPFVPSCLASPAVMFLCEGDKFLSHVPRAAGGGEPELPWPLSLEPPRGVELSNLSVPSADTCPAPISIHTISQVTPSPLFQLF